MRRGMGWMLAVGMGGLWMAACQGQSSAPDVGRANDPIHQKNEPLSASAGESGRSGGGPGGGVATDPNWQQHPSNQGMQRQADHGPYFIGRPQEIPRERQPAPLFVGSGSDSSRKAAIEQLEHK